MVDLLVKLRRPYYLEASLQKRISLSLLFGLFIFLFLFLFKPFGLYRAPDVASLALGYGFCTVVVMMLIYSIPPLFLPGIFNEEKWNIAKQIVWTLLTVSGIGLANAYYSIYSGIAPDAIQTYLWYFLYTFLIGVFPVTISVMLSERKRSRRFMEASRELNQELEKEHVRMEFHVLSIPSEGKGETLNLLSSELLYIQSADNYVEVYFLQEGRLQKKLLRASLKNISNSFQSYPEFFRCHKSYLVNMQQVSHVSGNAQGYRLHLHAGETSIPVSRSLNTELKRRIGAGRTQATTVHK